MAEQALTALEMLSRRHSKAILQAVSKKRKHFYLYQFYILLIFCEDEIGKQVSVFFGSTESNNVCSFYYRGGWQTVCCIWNSSV